MCLARVRAVRGAPASSGPAPPAGAGSRPRTRRHGDAADVELWRWPGPGGRRLERRRAAPLPHASGLGAVFFALDDEARSDSDCAVIGSLWRMRVVHSKSESVVCCCQENGIELRSTQTHKFNDREMAARTETSTRGGSADPWAVPPTLWPNVRLRHPHGGFETTPCRRFGPLSAAPPTPCDGSPWSTSPRWPLQRQRLCPRECHACRTCFGKSEVARPWGSYTEGRSRVLENGPRSEEGWCATFVRSWPQNARIWTNTGSV